MRRRCLCRPTRLAGARFPRAAALTLISILTVLSGCKRGKLTGRPSAAEIHAISREFLEAIDQAQIEDASVTHNLRADASDLIPKTFDYVDVRISSRSYSSAHAQIPVLLRQLDKVASRHNLIRYSLLTREGQTYSFRRGKFQTHTVHFHEQVVGPSQGAAPPAVGGVARLAIILDDLGNDRGAAEAIFALSCPITLSVLPNHAHSIDIAAEAHRRGYEVMLHLPMQSVGNEKPESQELHPGMAGGEVTVLVDLLLRSVPRAVGVNNHQGSQSTADMQLMDALMPVLRQHNLFYVDSRTTAATVAYDTAQRLGVRSGFRNTPFLDDVAQVEPVRREIQLAMRNARAKGEAIATGHPHAATLQALKEVLPQAKSQGVRLVFASEVVH